MTGSADTCDKVSPRLLHDLRRMDVSSSANHALLATTQEHQVAFYRAFPLGHPPCRGRLSNNTDILAGANAIFVPACLGLKSHVLKIVDHVVWGTPQALVVRGHRGPYAIKQNLKIKTFVGTSENAVKNQVWTAVK